MNIYFEDGQVVDETILATMKKAAEYCLDLEQVDQERTEISFRGRGRNQKSEPGIQRYGQGDGRSLFPSV